MRVKTVGAPLRSARSAPSKKCSSAPAPDRLDSFGNTFQTRVVSAVFAFFRRARRFYEYIIDTPNITLIADAHEHHYIIETR